MKNKYSLPTSILWSLTNDTSIHDNKFQLILNKSLIFFQSFVQLFLYLKEKGLIFEKGLVGTLLINMACLRERAMVFIATKSMSQLFSQLRKFSLPFSYITINIITSENKI